MKIYLSMSASLPLLTLVYISFEERSYYFDTKEAMYMYSAMDR